MPIYDFACRVCNKTFELIVSSSAEPLCPECGGQTLEKQLSLTASVAKVPGRLRAARGAAARAGHFSHYDRSSRPSADGSRSRSS